MTTTARLFTVDDLRRILREGAGTDEGVDLSGDIVDTELGSLGYDSLALLETTGRIEREFDVSLDDAALAATATAREVVDLVNAQLTAATAA